MAYRPTRRVGNARADRRRAGGTRCGDRGWEAEIPEDAVDHGCLLDQRDDAQTAATPGTGQHVHAEIRVSRRDRLGGVVHESVWAA